ncbi:fungal-specific transcription factor domain-containing protein [Trametes meyenii]|nr:fungal-specific transcription factor domain-containing protein [Trametes meyenii]
MPDVPSSPRKAVSSVSQQVRTQKKPGAPKPKGAVRAKSGCYTCRIRRKKCDEQPNEDGACQTCVRLRLQCLGFGAKRPEWMRENNSVTELREKIKTFLASQGMIKGHSGSGPRSTEQDPPVLVLVDHLHTSPSSPPTPTLSATSSSEGPRPPHNGMNTSFERAPNHYPAMPPPQEQQQYGHNWPPSIPELGHDPNMNRGPMLPNVNDMLYHPTAAPATAPPPPQPQPAPSMIQSPTSIVSASSSWPHVGAQYYSASISTPTYVPSTFYNHPHSSLAPSYNADLSNYSDDEVEQSIASPEVSRRPPLHVTVNGFGLAIPGDDNNLIHHYLVNVLPIQYLLADSSIREFMINLIQTSAEARNAACVLSALHLRSISYPPRSPDPDAIFNKVQTVLQKPVHNEGEAMAGLHIVSSFLFTGGRGAWNLWLEVACQYVQSILNDPRYYGPEHALKSCSESTRFIIKTTMWFDVLASVTTRTVPRFLETYRALFSGAYIGDPSTSAAPEISMLPVMGCENKIVLAIAEISNLAYWKSSQIRRGTLSIPELVHRGADIEETLLGPSSPQPLAVPLQPGMYGPQALQHHIPGMYGQAQTQTQTHAHAQAGQDFTENEVARRRRLTNDIFRASAKVYLHTVLSGDYPPCPEIMAAVTETVDALRRVPLDAPSVHRSVVRSVVFGICLSGCLTDDQRQRRFLLQMLEVQQRESVGNISEVRQLMEKVWARRDNARTPSHYHPVDWRAVMSESGNDLLLLV